MNITIEFAGEFSDFTIDTFDGMVDDGREGTYMDDAIGINIFNRETGHEADKVMSREDASQLRDALDVILRA